MKIAPSILSADFGNLKDSINKVQDAEWLHVDVMDGHFVPNISIGPLVVKGLRPLTKQILDTHLMISEPLKYVKQFIEAGSDIITFHVEAVSNVVYTIEEIKKYNVPVGISIKPGTNVDTIIDYLPLVDQVLVMSVEPGFGGQSFMPNALDKIKQLSSLKKELNTEYTIVVDGGINESTGALCKEAGVDVLVAGSYVFNSDNPNKRIASLR